MPETSTKNWKAFGIAQIVIWIGLILLSHFHGGWPPIWLQWLAGIATLTTAFILFKISEGAGGKPVTEEPWKYYASVVATLATLIIYLTAIANATK